MPSTPRDPRLSTETLLAAADALEDDGKLREAITLLTIANRRGATWDLEKRLVRLRHEAYAAIERDGGRELWPPEYADPFPEISGRPPEITPDGLDADVLGGAILHHGSLLVRGLVPPDRVDHLVHDIDCSFDAFDAQWDGTALHESEPWLHQFRGKREYGPIGGAKAEAMGLDDLKVVAAFIRNWVREGGGIWMVDSPRAMFDVLEAVDATDLRDAMAGYLGEEPAISVDKSTLRRVPPDTGTDWHQDGAFLGGGIRTVNVWITLDDCGGESDAPGLDIVPRRLPQVAETGTYGAMFDWSVGQEMVDRLAADTPVIRPEFNAGDALLFDELFLHRTGVTDGMTRHRHGIEWWFFAPSTYPADQIPLAL